MNYIFVPHIGVFMDMYLNNIVMYLYMAEDHIRHMKTVIDMLRTKKIYLSDHKLNFFVKL